MEAYEDYLPPGTPTHSDEKVAIIIHFSPSCNSSIDKAYTWIFTTCLWQL